MDQLLIAACALVAFSIFAIVAYVVSEERKARRRSPAATVHSGRDDVETRSRRAF